MLPRDPVLGPRHLQAAQQCSKLTAVLIAAVVLVPIGFMLGSEKTCSSLPPAGYLPFATDSGQKRMDDYTVVPASRGPPPYPSRHFAVFIIFSWNYDMFLLSLRSYMAAGWGRRIVIIDNSKDARLTKDAVVTALVGEVFRTRVKLTFSQVQHPVLALCSRKNARQFSGYPLLYAICGILYLRDCQKLALASSGGCIQAELSSVQTPRILARALYSLHPVMEAIMSPSSFMMPCAVPKSDDGPGGRARL